MAAPAHAPGAPGREARDCDHAARRPSVARALPAAPRSASARVLARARAGTCARPCPCAHARARTHATYTMSTLLYDC